VDHVIPGRWEDSRHPTDKELRATMVLQLPIDEASCKLRAGGPSDPSDDVELPFWAGELPIRLVPGEPVPAADLPTGLAIPPYVSGYLR
jgi:hypothetical protein